MLNYYPVKIVDPKNNNTVNSDYWFANICGRISCFDIEQSDTTLNVIGRLRFKYVLY
jgi:hypothetical protein